MSSNLPLNKTKAGATDKRRSSEEIDNIILKTLALKPVGSRELSRSTKINGTVVLRHITSLEQQLRIRKVMPSEYQKFGLVGVHHNAQPYTITEGSVQSAIWRKIIDHIEEYLSGKRKDVDSALNEFLPLKTNPICDYSQFIQSNDLLSLLRLANRIHLKYGEQQLSVFVLEASRKIEPSKELARNANEIVDNLLKNMDKDTVSQSVEIIINYYAFSLLMGSTKGYKYFEDIVLKILEYGGKDFQYILIEKVDYLFQQVEPFRTFIQYNQAILMEREWNAADESVKAILHHLRSIAIAYHNPIKTES